MNKLTLGEVPHVWMCADWHFNHDREFIWGARGFENVEQMNNAIIQRHNQLVRPDDEVYVLGDLMLGAKFGLEAGLNLIKQMNGNLHLIRGNHDTDNRWQAYTNLPNVVALDNAIYLKYLGYHFYLSHYPTLTGNIEKESLKQMTLNIFGHTHQKMKFFEDRPYMYCVCMDSNFCFPTNLADIIEGMKGKMDECIKMADGITPHDACVTNVIIPEPYEAWQKYEEYKTHRCEKCVHYLTPCPGAGFLSGNCPPGITYKRDPPDGGYYG